MIYSTYGSEILRTRNATSSKLLSANNSEKLVTRMRKQGGRIKIFFDTLPKALGRYFQMFQKCFPNSSNFK